MSDEIKVKKSDLWKVATVILVVALVVVLITSGGDKGTPNANVTNDGKVNLNGFIADSSVFPSLGPEDADTVVIEFSDFQCPYCALASGLPEFAQQYASQYPELIGSAKNIQDLAASGEIRFIYVPMSFLGQESVYAAQAGLCANKQGLFWEMHDAIFEAHDGKENNGKYSKDGLKTIASGISGLDTTAFNSCLDNDDTLSDVKKSASAASGVVSGTPSFFVNGKQVSASWSALSAAINA